MMAAGTGRRFYGQTWDGFHWTPYRGQTVGGGAFRGRRPDETPIEAFVAEMRRWEVVVPDGEGRLADLHPLGGSIALAGVRAGAPVVVRMNYFPAWIAHAGSQPVPLRAHDGQLAFDAPEAGSYTVTLEYPRRRGLVLLSLFCFVAGGLAVHRRLRVAPPAE
jgi:hypothetical protein